MRNTINNLAANLETIASQSSPFADQTKLEDFHELLRAYTGIFTKNVDVTKDYAYKTLKTLIKSKYLVAISGDKDSCVVILNRSNSDKKLQSMIDQRFTNGTYAPTTDSTLSDLKKF